MNKNESLKEVVGRKNFGAEHALMTTPQPCVMIATWDQDHTPDVMMAGFTPAINHIISHNLQSLQYIYR